MKKVWMIPLVACLLLSLTGCVVTPGDLLPDIGDALSAIRAPESEMGDPSSQMKVDETDSQPADDASDAEPDADGITLETPFFSMILPPVYVDHYMTQSRENGENYRYALTVLEVDSYYADCGGIVFELVLRDPGQDLSDIVPEKKVGVLSGADGTWDLVCVLPSDVQFDPTDPGAAAAYQDMYRAVDQVLATVTPAVGYTLQK